MLISVQNLPRDLRIIGILALLLAVFYVLLIGDSILQELTYFLNFVILFSSSIIYLTLASGVAKKEKWAWFLGIVIFSLLIIIPLVTLLFGYVSPIQFFLRILLPLLFLITFIQAKAGITINRHISIVPFVLFIVGFILNLLGGVYLIHLLLSRPWWYPIPPVI